VAIHVTRVTQDEAISRRGLDDACFDAKVVNGQLYLRRERGNSGNGRVYRVSFTAVTRDGGSADGSVLVGVPREAGKRLVANDGQSFNSLEGCPSEHGHMDMAMHEPHGVTGTLTTSLSAPRIEGARAIVEFTLAQPGEVSFAVFSVLGQRVAGIGSAVHGTGVNRATIPLERMAHGIYFVRMRAGGKIYTRRMPVLRMH
jgi:hypothetical protein